MFIRVRKCTMAVRTSQRSEYVWIATWTNDSLAYVCSAMRAAKSFVIWYLRCACAGRWKVELRRKTLTNWEKEKLFNFKDLSSFGHRRWRWRQMSLFHLLYVCRCAVVCGRTNAGRVTFRLVFICMRTHGWPNFTHLSSSPTTSSSSPPLFNKMVFKRFENNMFHESIAYNKHTHTRMPLPRRKWFKFHSFVFIGRSVGRCVLFVFVHSFCSFVVNANMCHFQLSVRALHTLCPAALRLAFTTHSTKQFLFLLLCLIGWECVCWLDVVRIVDVASHCKIVFQVSFRLWSAIDIQFLRTYDRKPVTCNIRTATTLAYADSRLWQKSEINS